MEHPLATGADAGPTRQVHLEKRSLKLPCLISDQTSMSAFFSAPVREAQKLLPSRKLHLVELYPGTTVVGFACTEYRQVQGLEPYNEVGIMLPVRYAPRLDVPLLPMLTPRLFRDSGYYFHRMLLDSRDAYDVGVKLHGLRKSMAEIRFEDQPFTRRCVVYAEGKHVLTLDMHKAKARSTHMTTHTYTMLEGHILRTPVPSRGQMGLGRGPKAARLTLGEHYIADELRALRLGPKPVFTLYGGSVESVLAAPDQKLQA